MDVQMPVCSRPFRLALVVSVFTVSYWFASGFAHTDREADTALPISCSFAAAAWFFTQMWELIRKASAHSEFSVPEENDNGMRRKKAS